MNHYKSDIDAIEVFKAKYNKLKQEIHKIIIGQDEIIRDVLICIFSRGHCLLIGVPGLAKTLLVKTIAQCLGLKFSRIQFTPDLMPSDLIGTEILDETRKFRFVKGPLFANIILADEINRTPPKTQSALLEAMEEKSITAANVTYQLALPFFVLATQNPIELEGTYPLPEAQLDRFMFNVYLDYTSYDDEKAIVKRTTFDIEVNLELIMSTEEILFFQHLIRKIPVPENVMDYAVRLVAKTRPNTPFANEMVNNYIAWGASPRASQYLVIGAKAHAVIQGKYSPDIEDVQAISLTTLRHRIIRNYKAEAENISTEKIIQELLKE